MNYAVVMAGGAGTRLWPLSRRKRPKQVLKLLDGQTLLGCCFERLVPVFDTRNILVLTNAGYAGTVRENLAGLPFDNVIAEPAVRDTSGAIGLAACILSKYDPDATMAVVTADHMIEPAKALQEALEDALAFVDAYPDRMVTFGIQPTFPSTALGYVRCGKSQRFKGCRSEVYRVEEFKEKPDEKTARKYLLSGDYLWNSGMFVWKARTILENLGRFLPEASEPLSRIQAAWAGPDQERMLEEWFPKMPKISIDYAVMEKAEGVYGIRLDCKWHDLGTFAALADVLAPEENNNVVAGGLSELLECRDNILVTEQEGHLIAGIGLEKMVVVHSPDATLVCRVEQADRIKELLELLEKRGLERFL